MTIERIDLFWLGLKKKVTKITPNKDVIVAASCVDPKKQTLVEIVSPDEIHVLYGPKRLHEFYKETHPNQVTKDNFISFKKDAINYADGLDRPLFVLQQGFEKVSWLDSTIHWRPTEDKK